MERHDKEKHKKERCGNHRVTALFWLTLFLCMSTSSVLAKPITGQLGTTQGNSLIIGSIVGSIASSLIGSVTENNDIISVAINSNQSNEYSEGWIKGLNTIFPRLERALIIATIINLFVIIFVVLFYVVKRRMTQFSSSSIGNIKLKSQSKNEFLDNLHNET